VVTPADPLSTYRPGLFDDQVVVVTGGGTGIGKACALGFAELGATLVLAGREEEQLQEAAAEIASFGAPTAIPVVANIRSVTDVERLRDTAYERCGRVDVLLNNAGGQFPSLPSQLSDNGWRAVVDLNLNGTWNMVQRFMAPMTEAGGGSIINVIHTYSFDRGARFFVHSGAARAGVLSMTRTMASFLAPHGVTVNALAPGMIDTTGMRTHEADVLDAIDVDALDAKGVMTTTRRMGTPRECAASAIWLASPAARYVTGTAVVADGGLMLDNWPDPWPRDAF
jgi:NAD(P)-dependent dehydrogenase (short-subunit alcohol dehydrogenase family)